MSLSASTPPNWVDDRTALGRLIAAVLAVEPLRQLLFLQARRMMIRTAETRGIPWRQRREELRRQAEPLLEACTNPATQIPAYYRARFHAYQEGNLCWLADWLERHGHGGVRVSGLDLSPQMLAVARVRDAGGRVHAWHHAAAEATGLAAASFDLITAQFLCHELPASATRAVLAEALRLLRPGGVLALVDQDPAAKAIRAMPPPLATLLKSTEPYLEDYFRLDLPAALSEAGFVGLRRVASDHRHRVLVATRP
jgi:SAM-dependent methyltransferase